MSVQAITCAFAIQGVSPAEKLVLLALANYANEDMECWPSQAKLASDTCMSERNVRRVIAALEVRRILSCRERRRQDGYRASDAITLHFFGEVIAISPDKLSPENLSPDNPANLTGQIVPISPDTMSGLTSLEPSLEPLIEPSTRPRREASGGFSKDFDAFWSLYPRRVGKIAAQKAFDVAKSRAKKLGKTTEDILESLRRSKWHDDPTKRPHPATWLNSGRWLDDDPTENVVRINMEKQRTPEEQKKWDEYYDMISKRHEQENGTSRVHG